MSFHLPLFGWKKPEVPVDASTDGADLGAAVTTIVAAKMGILRETLKAREGFLRAMAAQTDSKSAKADFLSRAAEVSFILGTVAE